jgi:hypothetical protein
MLKRNALLLFIVSMISFEAYAQTARYDRRFFTQLRSVFGRFRDSDLNRVFEQARPIQCSELVNDEGEWRTVAFFNDRRDLGDWYRRDFDEVKSDLAVFIFKGVCRGDHGPVQLTTKFPVTETIDAYNAGRIGLDQIVVNTNAPVRASFDTQSQAYSFDLPYLFLTGQQGNDNIYTLNPPDLLSRSKYATDVIDHWDCKSVSAENVTYQFLICQTSMKPRGPSQRNFMRSGLGSSAYLILSDGKEASSSVKLSFGDGDEAKTALEDAAVKDEPEVAGAWELPDPDEKLVNVLRDEFRIRFNPDSWTGKITNIQLLTAARLVGINVNPAGGADYCIWTPGAPASANLLLAETSVHYDIQVHDQDVQLPTSFTIQMRTPAGALMGGLQCIFSRAPSISAISYERWMSIVGDHVLFEVR